MVEFVIVFVVFASVIDFRGVLVAINNINIYSKSDAINVI